MCHLLIVDDEPIAVEGLKSGVTWSDIGITGLFTAYGPDEAKERFRTERIDILLCDIEMPQGTGLELLAWVREHYPRTETIFLTCHADFRYAKQAMQLGSLDYLLKPIPFQELREAVKKAMRKLDQDDRLNEFSQYGKYWVEHQPLIVERFWLDIVNQTIPGHAKAVKKEAEARHIPYASEMTFLPVLIRVRRWDSSVSLRDEKILEYAIRKSAEELLLNDRADGLLVTLGGGFLLALASGASAVAAEDNVRAACGRFVEACRSYFYADAACYVGRPVPGHDMAAAYNELRRLDSNNVAYDQGVFSLQEPPASKGGQAPPDTSLWSVLLEEGKTAQLLKAAEEYIRSLTAAGRMDPETLGQFVQDVQQMVYYALQVKGIQARRLFGDRDSSQLLSASTRSATDALAWIRHIVAESVSLLSSYDRLQSVVEKAKTYIRDHLHEELSREDIANHVYLNPDYLTRVFKKETGLSISDYVLHQRLDLAAGLLANTDLSVGAIAAKIGYSNFSHFSRIFKKYMGVNPAEYRSKRRSE
ncbi:response regulator [Paenibacillus sp.]|uniref:response regulator transcription factor n=1 Tax=Paenibacillus sp. TaxID=58172 RepID=UPI002811E347|nr:response regulator [Paenibacillus sp.]